jgi:hypothetical protein
VPKPERIGTAIGFSDLWPSQRLKSRSMRMIIIYRYAALYRLVNGVAGQGILSMAVVVDGN